MRDLVVVPAHRVGERERVGQVLELVGEPGHEQYRVRWDDGRESLFSPSSFATIRHRKHSRGEEQP